MRRVRYAHPNLTAAKMIEHAQTLTFNPKSSFWFKAPGQEAAFQGMEYFLQIGPSESEDEEKAAADAEMEIEISVEKGLEQ